MLLFSSVLILLSRKQTRQGYVPPVLFSAECHKWIDLFVGDMWKVVYRFYLLLRFFYSIFGGVRAVHHFSFFFFFFFPVFVSIVCLLHNAVHSWLRLRLSVTFIAICPWLHYLQTDLPVNLLMKIIGWLKPVSYI